MFDNILTKGVEVRQSTLGDITFLRDRLRKGDIDEIWASNHLTPTEALTYSFYLSKVCLTIVKEEPVGMFGVAVDPINSYKAIIWMLGSDKLDKVARDVVKATKDIIDSFLDEHEVLFNYVDARNKKSIRWLKYLGAEIQEAKPHGKDGLPFHLFKFERIIERV